MKSAVVLTAAFALSAQAQRAEPDVLAGLTLRVVVPARPDTVVYRRTISRNGADTDGGARTIVVQGTTAKDGSPLIHVVQRFRGSVGMITDTAVADARSFRAVAHQSHQSARTMRFKFSGAVVEGEISEATGPTGANGASGASTPSEEPQAQLVKQVVSGPIFDSNVIELVVASMPLASGFKSDVPFFIYESGGRVVMPVAVKERLTAQFGAHGNRDVWIVAVGIPGAPATFWVDSATRAVLRVQVDMPARRLRTTDDRETRLP